MTAIFDRVPIDYEVDMNRNMTEVYSVLLDSTMQEVAHRYMLGLYEF